MKRLKTATVAALLASFVSLQPLPVSAQDDQGNGKRHRIEQERRQEEKRELQRKRAEARRDYREDRTAARYDAQREYWDASRYYREDNARYRARRLSRNDWVYRGSDNRYYCRRDDGTTGLIIGGVSGAVLGNVIAPGGAKLLGTIIGGGAGALIGKKIDEGDIQCR